MDDFNCNEVKWKMFESRAENTWGNILLRLTMNNIMIQWATETTKYRKNTSRLDILFTKEINLDVILIMSAPL